MKNKWKNGLAILVALMMMAPAGVMAEEAVGAQDTPAVEISAEKIYIELKDNGPGISDVGMAMREGYSTASEEARNLGFGAGMGLPNIKKYADEFEIETEVGKGTTLKITVYC